jgi:hypothetical protein
MSFFKHKEEDDKSQLPQLPGLPDMPQLPELPQTAKKPEIQPLPTFPRNSFGDSLGLNAIKSSVNEPTEIQFNSTPIRPEERRTIEISDIKSMKPRVDLQNSNTFVSEKQPVFIKLDKFQDAVKKFEEIKSKVSEIENSLTKIKEIKEREEQELKAWEQEMQIIKDKVGNIDSSLFNKI